MFSNYGSTMDSQISANNSRLLLQQLLNAPSNVSPIGRPQQQSQQMYQQYLQQQPMQQMHNNGHSNMDMNYQPSMHSSPALSHQNSRYNQATSQSRSQAKSLQQRRDMAKRFFGILKNLPKPQMLQSFGSLQDTERILQILTNAQYVERKNQQSMSKQGQEGEEEQQIYTDDQRVRTFYPGQQTGNATDESNDEEDKYMDLEDKKILNKRKKRTTKIEDCVLDIDTFFKSRKRLRPSLRLEDETTTDSVHKDTSRSDLRRKLIEKYFSELPENEHTQKSVINYVKYMIKNVQYAKLTEGPSDSQEDELLIEWILENEPNILLEVSNYWIYNAYSIAPPDVNDDYYLKQLLFILKALEDNYNVLFYSTPRFTEWLSLLKNIPFFTDDIYTHIYNILSHLKADQEHYLQLFMEQMIVSQMTLKKVQRERILRMVLNEVISNESQKDKFEKMSQLLFSKFFDEKFSEEMKALSVMTVIDNFKSLNYAKGAFGKNTIQMFIEVANRYPENSQEYLNMIFEAYFQVGNPQLKALLSLQVENMFKALQIKSDNEYLLTLIKHYEENSDLKPLLKLIIATFATTEIQLSNDFIELCLKLSKTFTSAILAPILFQLTYDQVKDHLPSIVFQVKESLNTTHLFEQLDQTYTTEQDKIAELLYLVLKQPCDNVEHHEGYVKRLTQIQEVLVKKYSVETVSKVIERLIKNEKFHCKILISMILLMLKQNSKDQSGQDSTFKEQAMGMIKKLLNKNVWDKIPKASREDWECIKRGLVIYFGSNSNWSRDVYRIWRDYIPSNIRDEMVRESSEVKNFVNSYSKK